MNSDILYKAEAKVRYGEEIRRAAYPRTATEQPGMKKVVNSILDAIGL